ncbi:uncharacterized protein A1O9_07049 [Exophiala aquamarina CBS 119918]|uniref:PCI domain-containing protein n=1 Tax=Exophiala aquamarina CBS 119918 TaxID=1182545 RepID=A0A072P9S6_9EURO|nr:uncharacterized protein A1O9_07049 [Exophiala aquamarina CBS 119918]KEF56859.1 hypothetical protein A1O9_07049 [Exophiala aquamarina CBS 119918]
MDQAQTRALAAIQPFVHLATTQKNPTQRFVCDLINRAISAPGTYLFTELLQTPAVQNLRGSDSQSWLTVLEIFSWGTLEEYHATPGLPKLDDNQTLKLRQLSLLTLSSPFAPSSGDGTTNNLTYTSLLTSLTLPNAASLESLVAQSIYSGLLVARLSPTSNPPVVHVTSVAPLRDLRPQSLPALLQILQTWESRCTSIVTDLEAQITAIRTTATDRNTKARRRQDTVDVAVLSEKPLNETADAAKAAASQRALRSGASKLPSKRNLDPDAEGEEDELSDDDGRMDLDEGIDVGVAGAVGGGSGSASRGGVGGSSRGAKRNRGRGK